jgi:hypothetical protein
MADTKRIRGLAQYGRKGRFVEGGLMTKDNEHGEIIDLNWYRVLGKSWTCAACSEKHQGIFDLACAKPDAWLGGKPCLQHSFLEAGMDSLTEEFSV